MDYKRELQQTADGSFTLFVPELDEHYHSVNGAVQEAEHVFLQTGLEYFLHSSRSTSALRILEFGFGTGLNTLLTWKRIEQTHLLDVAYFSVEKYPLTVDMAMKLQYGKNIWPENASCDLLLHEAEWDKDIRLSEHFVLHKINGDFREVDFPKQIDLVFFDAFAPDKQSGVWEEDLFCRIYAIMKPGGVLTTYCAKGAVRRMLQAAGFFVERLPGPPGKREMLRATKR